jgi:alpha-galactosidase
LEGIARTIIDSGFTPGIWLAPFNVHYFTKALLRTPEICALCEDEKTQIEEWPFGPLRFVDPTHPEGEKFLTEIFSGLKRAGFSYFKVDFLHYLITFGKNKRFFKNDLGRMEILRLGLKIIRAAIGEDSYLLTCGCPPEAALGIADANRIGGDISTYNSTTQINSRFLATRYWMNNRLFTSDPDFLITRCDATANDTHHNPLHLNPEKGSRSGEPWKDEKDPIIWATLVGMSGGELVLADHLGKLNKKGFEMIRTTIQNSSPDAARPLDLMEKRHPEIWFREGVKPALAVINWSTSDRKITLPVSEFPSLKQFTGIADIWKGIKISEEKGLFTVDIPPLSVAWFVK